MVTRLEKELLLVEVLFRMNKLWEKSKKGIKEQCAKNFWNIFIINRALYDLFHLKNGEWNLIWIFVCSNDRLKKNIVSRKLFLVKPTIYGHDGLPKVLVIIHQTNLNFQIDKITIPNSENRMNRNSNFWFSKGYLLN